MAMINSIVDPEQDRIAEQLAQAAALRKQGFAANTGGGYQGGKVFMVGSPLGNIAQTLAGVYLGEKGRDEQQSLSDTRNSQLKQALAAMPGLSTTTPVYGPTEGGGNLPDITTPKPYQQVIDERQKWAAGMGDIRHPLAQAISQSAMLQGISAPEKLLEQENQLKLAREKLVQDAERRKEEMEWKRMFGMTNLDMRREQGQQGLDIKQQMVDIARDKADATKQEAQQKLDVKADERAKAADAANSLAAQGIAAIDQMIGQRDANGNLLPGSQPHGGFSNYVGATLVPGLRYVPGTDTAGYQALHEQIKGSARTEGVQLLKGTGSVSNAEGAAAATAITRMDKSQSEKEYVKAALEYRTIMQKAIDRRSRGVVVDPVSGKERPASAVSAPAAAGNSSGNWVLKPGADPRLRSSYTEAP
jgi:hypothetical protein